MTTTQIRIDTVVLRRLEAQKPRYLTTTGFISQIIEQALDGAITLGKPSQQPPTPPAPVLPSSSKGFSSNNKAVVSNAGALPVDLIEEGINRNPDRKPSKKKDPFASKNIPAELVPPELQQHAELLVDFWKVKKGTRSERAWNGLVNKLNGMTPADQAKALAAAYDAGWSTVYEPTDAPKQGKWKSEEPQMKHPAYRDAREIIAEQEARWKNIPSATGGKGVLEDIF